MTLNFGRKDDPVLSILRRVLRESRGRSLAYGTVVGPLKALGTYIGVMRTAFVALIGF